MLKLKEDIEKKETLSNPASQQSSFIPQLLCRCLQQMINAASIFLSCKALTYGCLSC